MVKDHVFDYDAKYWKDKSKLQQMKVSNYTRVRLIDTVDTDELSFKNLRENGLNSKIQGPEKINGELRDYIMPFFQIDLTAEYYPEEISDGLEEGHSKTILVNRYERNSKVRKECIDAHGVQCQVCKIDFESTYGIVGKDFIHVHHIIPLSEIKKGYIVDPEHDLIPVCPNCHAMLHRKENGAYLTIEELKKRMKNKKNIMV
ncbi:HNH endonuclease [Gottfriedia sp. OAE603]|uniref:HNH endonuclease n=1 Tax=Gottfriedia sp. OAE603 TaxID=2663872 RepID=UPI0019FDD7A6